MKERRITALDANGLMTDAVLARIADLDHVTTPRLGGSRQLTDDGLRHLARMPQLQHLDLTSAASSPTAGWKSSGTCPTCARST